MSQKESAKDVRARRYARASSSAERLSYTQQQELYFESIGVFKGNTERRNARYVSDIEYIQGIVIGDILDDWKDKVLDVLKQHDNDNVKKNARYKTKVIKVIYDFKKQKEMHDDALAKMLFSLGD